ncbi:unnamed protein product [Staurois parvus]|uniref:Uncharacterized protein n=1 Tax=Staurois parvus TaxID=386267 RepID=A0ABN9FJB8_9NEOB|nr:unnamed protein product [Staurois parvus]
MMGHYSSHTDTNDGATIIGVSGRNSAPSLMSERGIVPHHWCQWEE